MAVLRRVLRCDACKSAVITRTAPGYRATQTYRFPCPKCALPIAYAIHLGEPRQPWEPPDVNFERATNATWVDGADAEAAEEDAIAVLTFDAELLAPREGGFSPFQSSFRQFQDYEAFQRDEAARHELRARIWPLLRQLLSHFENDQDALFDALANERFHRSPDEPRKIERLYVLHDLTANYLRTFTFNRDDLTPRIGQRIGKAQAQHPELFKTFALDLVQSGRASALWRQLHDLHREFMDVWESISPILNLRYWTTWPADLTEYAVSSKGFDELKHFYVNCFETLCDLSVIAIAIEALAEEGTLSIPARRGPLDVIPGFADLHNANKPDHLAKYALTAELFVPHIDADLRNGIGHNSALYDFHTDEIVCMKDSGGVISETRRENYTLFCHRILDVFSTLLRLELYMYMLLTLVGGDYRPPAQRTPRPEPPLPRRGFDSSARYRTI